MKKNIFKNIILVSVLFAMVFGLFTLTSPVNAQIREQLDTATQNIDMYSGAPTPLATVIGLVIKYILGFLGLIFLILVTYAGIIWMTAQGNPDNVKKAKDIIIMGVIGLIIVVAAYSITDFVVEKVEGLSGSSSTDTGVGSS